MNNIPASIEEKLHRAVNPFTEKLTIRVNKRPPGEIDFNGPCSKREQSVDRPAHIRLFRTRRNSQLVYELSNKGLWLFTYLLLNVKQGKNYVQIIPEHYKQKVGVSADNTLLDAKKELMSKGFIVPTGIDKTIYWINPRIFSSGYRTTPFLDNLTTNNDQP